MLRLQSLRQLGKRLDPRQWTVPSWLLSLVFHAALFVILAQLFTEAAPRGNLRERTADVGIVLKHQGEEGEFFAGEDSQQQTAAANAAASTHSAKTSTLEQALDDAPPSDPTSVLPAAQNIIGPGALQSGGVGTALTATQGPGGGSRGSSGRGGLGPGRTRTSVFGTVGEGSKFVYVFDRSGSTGGPGRSALRAAKAELLQSLQDLDTVHQFQIIFYNENPVLFNPSGTPGKLAFGTSENKERARRFIGSITPDGGTRHDEALKLALRLQPDVIFFFTDADEPRLSARQMEEIHRRANGIAINAIEFGLGPKQGGMSFLEKLAQQNGGQYAYVDITKLSTAQ
ncbi:MAG: VWA domain-containing protein [Thermoguttaceae bacterium]